MLSLSLVICSPLLERGLLAGLGHTWTGWRTGRRAVTDLSGRVDRSLPRKGGVHSALCAGPPEERPNRQGGGGGAWAGGDGWWGGGKNTSTVGILVVIQ